MRSGEKDEDVTMWRMTHQAMRPSTGSITFRRQGHLIPFQDKVYWLWYLSATYPDLRIIKIDETEYF